MNPKSFKIVVFSDLDGTILNEKYAIEVQPIIDKLLSMKVAIVLASSKTRDEIEFYRKKLALTDPFIVENGSAIYIPKNYFAVSYQFSKQLDRYNVLELGTTYSVIREKLFRIKSRVDPTLRGFGDMTAEEIAKDSGLPLFLAALAKKREYDEPLNVAGDKEQEVLSAILKEGLCYTKGGKYIHVMGNTHKGKAVATLQGLYLKEFSRLISVGVGDSSNDLPMLDLVDRPFWVDTSRKDSINLIWQRILEEAKKLHSRHNIRKE